MKTICTVLTAVAVAGAALLAPSAASAEEPCGSGAVTRSLHNVHELLEPYNAALSELSHSLECQVAPLDPTGRR